MAQAPLDTNKVHQLEEVSLIMPKEPESLGRTSQTLITENEIELSNSESVADAVNLSPGILVRDYGGLGGLKTVSVRSLGAEHTVVFYDGIRCLNAQNGISDLGRISAENISSIKIVKGINLEKGLPASAYASSATLSIQSKKPGNDNDLSASFSCGSFSYYSGSFLFNRKFNDKLGLGLSGTIRNSEGNYPYSYENGTNKISGFRNNGDLFDGRVEGNLLWKINSGKSLSVKGFFSGSNRGLPGAIIYYNDVNTDRSQNMDSFIQSIFSNKASENNGYNIYLKAGYNKLKYTDPEYLNSKGYLENLYAQYEASGSFSGFRQLRKWLFLNLSSDLHYNHLNWFSNPNPGRFTSVSDLNFLVQNKKFEGQAGISETIFWEEGQQVYLEEKLLFSPYVGFSFSALKGTTIRASYKRNFRLPNFNELYYNLIGNTSLKPEKAQNLNLGITHVRERFLFWDVIRISADVFQSIIIDKIVAVPTQNLFVWSMKNVREVRARGVEISGLGQTLLFKKIHFDFMGSYTYQLSSDLSYGVENQLAYTPINTWNLTGSLRRKNIVLGYFLTYCGERYTQQQNIPENYLSPYMIHDCSIAYKINVDHYLINLKAEINNVFDLQYQVINNFPMPGRYYKVKIAISYE